MRYRKGKKGLVGKIASTLCVGEIVLHGHGTVLRFSFLDSSSSSCGIVANRDANMKHGKQFY